jgi:hypothetical protein
MKGLDLALRLALFGGRGEGLTNRLPIYFVGQAVIGAVARLVRLMTTAFRLTAAAANGCDGAAAKITQIDDAGQNGGPLLFKRNERVGQVAPPFLTYQYVRNTATKKEPLGLAHPCRAPILNDPARKARSRDSRPERDFRRHRI